MFKKSFEAMNSGGVIVVRDFILDENRTTPASASLFAVNMLVGTKDGSCYTEKEVTAWFQKAGFIRMSYSRISEDSSILLAYKPD
jgi:hypothetical protein